MKSGSKNRRGHKPSLKVPAKALRIIGFILCLLVLGTVIFITQRPKDNAPATGSANPLQDLVKDLGVPATNLLSEEQLPPPTTTIDTNDPGSLLRAGTEMLHAGYYGQAAALLVQSLRLDDQDSDTHFNLAFALTRLRRTNDAIAAYSRVLALDPQYVEAHINLGNIYRGRKDYFEATKHFSAALREMPDHSTALNSMGHCLAAQGKTDEAISYFSQAVRQNPAYLEARFNLGNAFLRLRRTDEAITEFREILKLDPNFRPAQEGLAAAQRPQN